MQSLVVHNVHVQGCEWTQSVYIMTHYLLKGQKSCVLLFTYSYKNFNTIKYPILLSLYGYTLTHWSISLSGYSNDLMGSSHKKYCINWWWDEIPGTKSTSLIAILKRFHHQLALMNLNARVFRLICDPLCVGCRTILSSVTLIVVPEARWI